MASSSTPVSFYPTAAGSVGPMQAPTCLGYLDFPSIQWWFLTGTLWDRQGKVYSTMNNLVTQAGQKRQGRTTKQIVGGLSWRTDDVEYQILNSYAGQDRVTEAVSDCIVPMEDQVAPCGEHLKVAGGKRWDGNPSKGDRHIPYYCFESKGPPGRLGTPYRLRLSTDATVWAWQAEMDETVETLEGWQLLGDRKRPKTFSKALGRQRIRYHITLNGVDQRGIVPEGLNGFVGDPISGDGSYEVAMCRLAVTDWSIRIEPLEKPELPEFFWGEINQEGGKGLLWLDRQGLTRKNRTYVSDSNPSRVLPLYHGYRNGLYRGCWIATNFCIPNHPLDGFSMVTNAFWRDATQPRDSDLDATEGFCNVYTGEPFTDLETTKLFQRATTGLDTLDVSKKYYPYHIEFHYSSDVSADSTDSGFAEEVTITLRAGTRLRSLVAYQVIGWMEDQNGDASDVSGVTDASLLIDTTQDFRYRLRAICQHSTVTQFSNTWFTPYSEIAASLEQAWVGDRPLDLDGCCSTGWMEQMLG